MRRINNNSNHNYNSNIRGDPSSLTFPQASHAIQIPFSLRNEDRHPLQRISPTYTLSNIRNNPSSLTFPQATPNPRESDSADTYSNSEHDFIMNTINEIDEMVARSLQYEYDIENEFTSSEGFPTQRNDTDPIIPNANRAFLSARRNLHLRNSNEILNTENINDYDNNNAQVAHQSNVSIHPIGTPSRPIIFPRPRQRPTQRPTQITHHPMNSQRIVITNPPIETPSRPIIIPRPRQRHIQITYDPEYSQANIQQPVAVESSNQTLRPTVHYSPSSQVHRINIENIYSPTSRHQPIDIVHWSRPVPVTNTVPNTFQQSQTENQENSDTVNICTVCLENKINTALDCGHTLCNTCAAKIRICHICRRPIRRKMRIYL